METPAITIVVPTRDRPHLLEPCLASLRAAMRPDDELIVSDSASTLSDVRDVALAFAATVVRCDEPGTSRARNAGWRAAQNEVVAFVDDDVRVDPGWAAAIASSFTDASVAFVTGYIGEPPTSVGTPAIAQMIETEPKRLDQSTTGIIGHSANLAVRRSVLTRIGGFDELLGPGGPFKAAEDLDLFDRLFLAGCVGSYQPAARSYHESWRRIRDYIRLQGSYGYGSGARIAKLLRMDRSKAGAVASTSFIDWAGRPLVQAILHRAAVPAAAKGLRLATTLVGFMRAIFYPVSDGHLRRRGRAKIS